MTLALAAIAVAVTPAIVANGIPVVLYGNTRSRVRGMHVATGSGNRSGACLACSVPAAPFVCSGVP